MRGFRSTALLVLSLLTSGCASTGGVPQPFPRPGAATRVPERTAVGTAGTRVDAYAVTATALELRGSPYRNGGADPRGFDCSGFVEYVFGQHGIRMPRTVAELFVTGVPVDANQAEAGDLLFFSTRASGATHVAIALGGDVFVHAPSTSGVVRVERMGAGYWGSRLIGVRRVLRRP